jgi:glycosyltransferase involved in cell wall biosynthesis
MESQDISKPRASTPDLSVVVIVHDMAREAPRTLQSLSADYQRNIRADDYEVIVVDNGSPEPFRLDLCRNLHGNYRLLRLEHTTGSPARAINAGLAVARGNTVGVLIDGARLVTPGLLHLARSGAGIYPDSVVAALGWYLGDDFQSHAVQAGYDKSKEDLLLDSIRWPADGYRLFEIATPDESSRDVWFSGPSGRGMLFESNALFASARRWREIGGAEERFSMPGGGLLNFDLFRRMMQSDSARLTLLLGEGTFHQLHGGIATNAAPDEFRERYARWSREHMAIRGERWTPVALKQPPVLLGTPHAVEWARIVRSAVDPTRRWPEKSLGPTFDLWSWPEGEAPPARDNTALALRRLMHSEFRAGRYDSVVYVARKLRSYSPEDEEARRVLRRYADYYDRRSTPNERRDPLFHAAASRALSLLGDPAGAARELQLASEAREAAGTWPSN